MTTTAKDPKKQSRFSQDWFTRSIPCWDLILKNLSNSGQFSGGVEHHDMDLKNLRQLFEANVGSVGSPSQVRILQGYSFRELSRLIVSGEDVPGFDFVSVDASHQATDVLMDCLLGFQLLRKGGVMALDDYLWSAEAVGEDDILNSPKIAIDAFTNIFRRKARVIPNLPLYQLYLQKL
ncbi:MAG: class I SAM-dependent methyltransferase [Verrucomicrobia bacterium]|nr:class I SAM-dependent methyltransferase [Verrucomicrobiota bacterium]